LISDIQSLKGDQSDPSVEVDGRVMTVIGICGLVVNLIDAVILYWGNVSHGHSHGSESHEEEEKKESEEEFHSKNADSKSESEGHGHSHSPKVENVNVKAAFIHVLGDSLQSLGVITAAVIVWVGNETEYHDVADPRSYFNLADPIASLLFGIITLITTLRITRQTVDVLMERVPEGFDSDKITNTFSSINNVKEVYDLHIWSISLGKVALSVHLLLHEQQNSDNQKVDSHQQALDEAKKICKRLGIDHSTIQIETHKEELSHFHNEN